MSRWSALSDWDYWDDLERYRHRRAPQCLDCGRPMEIVYNGDDRPIHARCEYCHEPQRTVQPTAQRTRS